MIIGPNVMNDMRFLFVNLFALQDFVTFYLTVGIIKSLMVPILSSSILPGAAKYIRSNGLKKHDFML